MEGSGSVPARLATMLFATCMLGPFSLQADDAVQKPKTDYLVAVKTYADALLEHGRDVYGEEKSPLFATTLDRETMRLFEGEALERIRAIPRKGWDIRPGDRMVTGANPMHHENLYQVLYGLSAVTGDRRYAEEADRALKWFFEHSQSEATGLLAWGEHLGWDFLEEKATGGAHEFYRPWVLWDRSYALAPERSEAFARGLWAHQIGDQETGNFSRHADYWKHRPGRNYEFPRHGGFYIAAWAKAYKRTKDADFLTAIETLVRYFDQRRSPESDAIPCQSGPPYEGKRVWPPNNLSMAVDLWDAATMVPEDLAGKLRQSAARTDTVYLSLDHELTREGRGFVAACHTDTLEVEDYGKGVWGAGYGSGGDATTAMLCLLRYRQVELDGYRALVLQTGERYVGTEPDRTMPLHPGTLGDVIFLMLACHELSGDQEYKAEAHRFAELAIDVFLKDGSPLPPATTQHAHYEAITRGDTLMMALLQLALVDHPSASKIRLIYTDR